MNRDRELAQIYNIERQIMDMFMFLVDQGIITLDEYWQLRHKNTDEVVEIIDKIRAGLFSSTNQTQDRVNPWSGREEAREDEFMCGLNEIMEESETLFNNYGHLRKLKWLLHQINRY